MMGAGPRSWESMFGAPSLLGRRGVEGAVGDVVEALLREEDAIDFCGDGSFELDADLGFVVGFVVDSVSSSRSLRNFWDDLRGGGLGGGGCRRVDGFLSLVFRSPSLTVELEDDEVKDSLTAARP